MSEPTATAPHRVVVTVDGKTEFDGYAYGVTVATSTHPLDRVVAEQRADEERRRAAGGVAGALPASGVVVPGRRA
jgi:hypothetical protein